MPTPTKHHAQKHRRSEPRASRSRTNLRLLPWAFSILSLLMMAATGLLVWHFWSPAYFALTGQPFHWPAAPPAVAKADPLPTFTTSQSISDTLPSRGSNETISISATSSRSTKAVIKAWVESPKHKQVWRSPKDKVTSFAAGLAVTTQYHYTIPATLPAGKYHVSFILNSTDDEADYNTTENFAEFSVQ